MPINRISVVSIIVAVAQNGIIGCRNRLIWHISEDLKRFKRITTGHPVVMGRKTFESIGRALPGRTNVVISRNPEYTAPGCETAASLEAALSRFPGSEEIFIIGGAEIYRQSMPLADRLYLTVVEHDYEGDAVFPAWDPSQWELIVEERYERGTDFPYPYRFEDYRRIR